MDESEGPVDGAPKIQLVDSSTQTSDETIFDPIPSVQDNLATREGKLKSEPDDTPDQFKFDPNMIGLLLAKRFGRQIRVH